MICDAFSRKLEGSWKSITISVLLKLGWKKGFYLKDEHFRGNNKQREQKNSFSNRTKNFIIFNSCKCGPQKWKSSLRHLKKRKIKPTIILLFFCSFLLLKIFHGGGKNEDLIPLLFFKIVKLNIFESRETTKYFTLFFKYLLWVYYCPLSNKRSLESTKPVSLINLLITLFPSIDSDCCPFCLTRRRPDNDLVTLNKDDLITTLSLKAKTTW